MLILWLSASSVEADTDRYTCIPAVGQTNKTEAMNLPANLFYASRIKPFRLDCEGPPFFRLLLATRAFIEAEKDMKGRGPRREPLVFTSGCLPILYIGVLS